MFLKIKISNNGSEHFFEIFTFSKVSCYYVAMQCLGLLAYSGGQEAIPYQNTEVSAYNPLPVI